MAGKHNIVVGQGETFTLNFTVLTDGVPWDLSDYTFAMQVRRSTSSATKLLDLTSATMTSLGKVSVTVSATIMAAITAGRWVYDIELTSSSLEVTRILEGRFIVTVGITR